MCFRSTLLIGLVHAIAVPSKMLSSQFGNMLFLNPPTMPAARILKKKKNALFHFPTHPPLRSQHGPGNLFRHAVCWNDHLSWPQFRCVESGGLGKRPWGLAIVRTNVSSLKHSCKWQPYSILENESFGGDSVGVFSGMAKTSFWGDPVIAYWGKAGTISWGDPVVAFAGNTKTRFCGDAVVAFQRRWKNKQ